MLFRWTMLNEDYTRTNEWQTQLQKTREFVDMYVITNYQENLIMTFCLVKEKKNIMVVMYNDMSFYTSCYAHNIIGCY